MYCATSLSSAPPFFSRKRRNETSPLSLLSSSKTSFLHFLTDRTAISTIMPSSGVPVKRPYNCVLPASMGSATPVEGSTRKNMCHLPWRFLHVSDVFEIHRRLKIAGRNHISRCHHLDGHRRTSVPAGGSLRTQPQPRQRVAASHATVHVARIVPSGMLAEAASRTMRKGDANNRPPFAESSGNTKIMREKCGRYVGETDFIAGEKMRNPISCRTDSGLRCHFPDSYSTVQENFSHVRPSRLFIVPTFHIFQKDHPHRQSNPHEDASSRLVGANRKPNVFIPETSRSSKYLFKKVVDCFL